MEARTVTSTVTGYHDVLFAHAWVCPVLDDFPFNLLPHIQVYAHYLSFRTFVRLKQLSLEWTHWMFRRPCECYRRVH
jgi:hypothetical protein